MKAFLPFDTMGSHWNIGSCHDFPRIARESGFNFNLYRGRVDWTKIGSINVDKMVRERDLETLQDALSSIMSCSLDSEYDLKVLDPNFVKLFRLAQLATDFLLYCRNFLDHCVTVIQEQLRVALQDVEHLQKLDKKKTEEIMLLHKKLKAKLKTSKAAKNSPSAFKCCVCKKEFVGEQYLLDHKERRHPELSGVETHNSFQKKEVESLRQQVQQLQDRLFATEEALKCNQSPSLPDNAALQTLLQHELQKIKSCNDRSPKAINSPVESQPIAVGSKESMNQTGKLPIEESRTQSETKDEGSTTNLRLDEQIKPVHQVDHITTDEAQANLAALHVRIELQNDEIKILRNQLLEQHKSHEADMQKKLDVLQLQHRADLDELRSSFSKGQTNVALSSQVVPDGVINSVELQPPFHSQVTFQAWEKSSNVIDSSAVEVPTITVKEGQVPKDNVPLKPSKSSVATSIDQSLLVKAREEPAVQEEYVSPSDQESSNSFEDVSAHGSDIKNNKSEQSLSSNVKIVGVPNNSKSIYAKSESSSSGTASETESSSSYDSDSQSTNSELQPLNTSGDGNPSRVHLTPEVLNGLKEDLVGLLNRRMRELGIDPEWERLPVASFNSTMATVKHHQNISARSHKSYSGVQEALRKEVEKRVAEKAKVQSTPSNSLIKKKKSPGSLSIFARIKSHVKSKLSHSGRLSPHSKSPQKLVPKQKSRNIMENVYSEEPSTSHSKSSNSHEYEVLQEKITQSVSPVNLTKSVNPSVSKENDAEKSNVSILTSKAEAISDDSTDNLDDKSEERTKLHLSGVSGNVNVYSRSMYANLNKSEFEFERKELSSDLSVKQPVHLQTSTPIKTSYSSSPQARSSNENKALKISFVSSEIADNESTSELESDYNDIVANTSEKIAINPQTRPHTTRTTAELLANVAKFRKNSFQINSTQSIVKSNLKSSLSTGNIMKKRVVFRDEKDGFDTIELGPAHVSYESLAPQRSHSETSLATTYSSPRNSDQPVPAPRSSLVSPAPPDPANAESTDSDWDWDKEISEVTAFKQTEGASPSSPGSSSVIMGSGSTKESQWTSGSADVSRVADIVKDIEKKLQKETQRPSFGFNTAGPTPATASSSSLTGASFLYSGSVSVSKSDSSPSPIKSALVEKELILDDFSSS